jgi:hypothetical protein
LTSTCEGACSLFTCKALFARRKGCAIPFRPGKAGNCEACPSSATLRNEVFAALTYSTSVLINFSCFLFDRPRSPRGHISSHVLVCATECQSGRGQTGSHWILRLLVPVNGSAAALLFYSASWGMQGEQSARPGNTAGSAVDDGP